MTRRTAQKAATQRKLLTTAKRLFIDQGYDHTTTREIAQACGVSIGTVFAHFPDKPALLKAILLHEVEAELVKVRQNLAPQASAFEALYQLAEHLFAFYGQHPALSKTLLAQSLFQYGAFEAQLKGHVAELAARLVAVDRCPAAMADTVAKNLMANYFMQLVAALDNPEQFSGYLAELKLLCQPLQDWVQSQQFEKPLGNFPEEP